MHANLERNCHCVLASTSYLVTTFIIFSRFVGCQYLHLGLSRNWRLLFWQLWLCIPVFGWLKMADHAWKSHGNGENARLFNRDWQAVAKKKNFSHIRFFAQGPNARWLSLVVDDFVTTNLGTEPVRHASPLPPGAKFWRRYCCTRRQSLKLHDGDGWFSSLPSITAWTCPWQSHAEQVADCPTHAVGPECETYSWWRNAGDRWGRTIALLKVSTTRDPSSIFSTTVWKEFVQFELMHLQPRPLAVSVTFSDFFVCSKDGVRRLIMSLPTTWTSVLIQRSMPTKSCTLDSIPTDLMKEFVDIVFDVYGQRVASWGPSSRPRLCRRRPSSRRCWRSHRWTSTSSTSSSAIAERPRCRVG